MAHPMDDDERRSFLMHGTRTAVLSTVRADGRPHAAPVWFVLDGDDLVFMTGADTVKGRNLTRDPRAVLTVDDPTPPYSFVTLTGTVQIQDAAADLLDWSIAIARRYVDAADAEQFGRRNAVPGELLLRLRPEHTVALADLAD